MRVAYKDEAFTLLQRRSGCGSGIHSIRKHGKDGFALRPYPCQGGWERRTFRKKGDPLENCEDLDLSPNQFRQFVRVAFVGWWHTIQAMRTKLRLIALAVAFLSLAFWFFGGPNWGWTKTTVVNWQVDAVTEIHYPIIEKRFIPGVDVLALALIAAAALFGGSFWARRN
jgi:hypothetical protein